MADFRIPFFPHRLNRDGTYDSICLQCYATVANARTSVELEEYDVKHICGENCSSKSGLLGRIRSTMSSLLAERGCYRRPHSN
jgi:hypothetical protein